VGNPVVAEIVPGAIVTSTTLSPSPTWSAAGMAESTQCPSVGKHEVAVSARGEAGLLERTTAQPCTGEEGRPGWRGIVVSAVEVPLELLNGARAA